MASAAACAPKRCYYEVLGLSRDCSPTDIKLAFRRLALSLHPDKQPPGSDLALATAAFQELQHAHSVLSDPQERAYYDSHRSQIIFSHPASAGAKSASTVPDLFAFFSSSAFSGFSDTGRGFYKVYGDVFDRVFAQELAYVRRMGVPEPAAPPVTAFYSYWLGFGSGMDFGWAAAWDAARGESRRVRRLMEEDNKKAMRKARREYNDAVRGLVAFCKKRDKRVVDMVLKKKLEEEKRKAEEKERRKEEDKRKKERAMAYQEHEWARAEEGLYDEDEEEEMRAKKELSEEESLKKAEEGEGDWNEVDMGFDFKPTQESDDASAFSDAAEELAEEFESNYAGNGHHGKCEVQPEGSVHVNDVDDIMEGPSSFNVNNGAVIMCYNGCSISGVILRAGQSSLEQNCPDLVWKQWEH
ncbi:DNAJ protein JJJ1-like protein [Zea mays]|uniref:DNAJ protein JJJ1-like protein n=1 Tax=Zea mays TaxID=4577 RepID=A0A1D6IV51_MAIZE|nr:DNAJ protein JJJ1-like protein [Zea mays]